MEGNVKDGSARFIIWGERDNSFKSKKNSRNISLHTPNPRSDSWSFADPLPSRDDEFVDGTSVTNEQISKFVR